MGRFIGREKDLQAIYDRFLQAGVLNRANVLIVTGEAGIGKSVLAGEVLSEIRNSDPARKTVCLD